jgi:hypothetical protein
MGQVRLACETATVLPVTTRRTCARFAQDLVADIRWGGDSGVSKTAVIGWIAGLVVVVLVSILVILAVTPSTSPNSNAGNGSSPGPGDSGGTGSTGAGSPGTGTTGTGSTSSFAAVVQAVTHVPASVLDRVGVGGHLASTDSREDPLTIVTRTAAKLPAVDGRPALFFLGAEFCPFCATERWSLIIALSRFGTFTGLGASASSPSDYAPNTQTFTFRNARYTSRYLAFEPVEVEDVNRNPFQSPNPAEVKVLQAWDPSGLFPFIDVANRFIGVLPTWDDPSALAGRSRAEIAAAVRNPASSIGATIDAVANYLTAGICAVDGGKPGSVCGSSGVRAAAAQLSQMPATTPIGS